MTRIDSTYTEDGSQCVHRCTAWLHFQVCICSFLHLSVKQAGFAHTGKQQQLGHWRQTGDLAKETGPSLAHPLESGATLLGIKHRTGISNGRLASLIPMNGRGHPPETLNGWQKAAALPRMMQMV